ncbi:MAG TPA: hypothetical protein ENH10_03905 [Bacteroidetes bacterium]|nr:hypothetical protein BMS3Bbin04_01692 [bacterium BMS3Bbin04]HDO65162.1 hypothetical protein [Bacteroidota bacterium]HEX04287.1 hypothetical protein [Bacteroidota bacterium]
MDYLSWILPGALVVAFVWLAIMGWRRRHMLFHQSKFAAEVTMRNYQAQQQQAAMTYVMQERDMKIEEDSGKKK